MTSSSTIASNAVVEAKRTSASVKGLSDAAKEVLGSASGMAEQSVVLRKQVDEFLREIRGGAS